MAYLPGMSEFQASDYANELLDILTKGGELHSNAVLEGIEGVRIESTVSFKEDKNKPKHFDIVVAFTDTITGSTAYVSSEHTLIKGEVVISPKLYYVHIVQGSGNLQYLTKSGYPQDAINERLIPRQAEQFHQPIARALHILERLELGLKYKFES